MDNSLSEIHQQGIKEVVFIILDWIFVLMSATTMILNRYVSERELATENLTERRFIINTHFNKANLE